MAKKGVFDFLGESLGVTGPSETPAAEKKKDGTTGVVGQIMSEIVGPELSGGLRQGVADFVDDVFHKSPLPEPRKQEPKKQAKLAAPVASGPAQNERLLGSGGQGASSEAEMPQSRGNRWVNTAVVILGGGVDVASGVIKTAVKIGKAAQETHRRKVEQKQAEARTNATIIDGEVKE